MKSSTFFINNRADIRIVHRPWRRIARCVWLVLALWFGIAGLHSKPAHAADALYSAIQIDLAPIKATGLGDFADPIGPAVKHALEHVYAGRIAPNNSNLPRLVISIKTMEYGQEQEDFISKFAPHSTHTFDQMSGTASVRKGKTDVKHVSVLGNSRKSGAWPLRDDVEPLRLKALAEGFADAVRDALGD